LETKRTITSVSLAEERFILKQIAVTHKNKQHVQDYQALDQQIQSVKVRNKIWSELGMRAWTHTRPWLTSIVGYSILPT